MAAAAERLRRQLDDMQVSAALTATRYAFMDDPQRAARLAALKRKAEQVFAERMSYTPSAFVPLAPAVSAPAAGARDGAGSGEGALMMEGEAESMEAAEVAVAEGVAGMQEVGGMVDGAKGATVPDGTRTEAAGALMVQLCFANVLAAHS